MRARGTGRADPGPAPIHEWNGRRAPRPAVAVLDETLRDGIQSPSVRNPSIEQKLELLHLMEACGVQYVNVGLPGAGAAALADCLRLVQEIRNQALALRPCCAARTHPDDVRAALEVAQRAGHPVEVCTFLGCSPVRRLVEGWDLDRLETTAVRAIEMAVREGASVSFVTEDTTRTDPQTLERLYTRALEAGARRLILTDTVGHATPRGLRRLLRWLRRLLARLGVQVGLDWHGHNDRGLALALALQAAEEGVDRVHGTCLGVGERSGNASLDLLLVNLSLDGRASRDLRPLRAYVEAVSRHYGVPIPPNYPVFGRDAFRTATGVHAAAIVKALQAGRPDLADQVYSSVPASALDRHQEIEVGYYSGRANIRHWLSQHGLEPTPERLGALWELAKASRTTLTEGEILEFLAGQGLLTPGSPWQAKMPPPCSSKPDRP
ncbi:MAG TPA: 2-isopropylmalate synthase [Candidatus Nitrosotenuis sp.]|nr:2-isopropylmalate synthase [Candidatus Nitrosotenuis sp.]